MKGILKFLAVSGVAMIVFSSSMNITYANEIETYYDEEGNVQIVENQKLEVPELYTYTLTEDEQKALDEALDADGKEAAEIVNSLENDYAFLNVARSVMDSYFNIVSGNNELDPDYEVEIDGRYEEFKAGLDKRAEELISECDVAFDEKSKKNTDIGYVRDSILVSFSAAIPNEEIARAVKCIARDCSDCDLYFDIEEFNYTHEEKIDKLLKDGKLFAVYLRNSQTYDKVIDIFNSMDGVLAATKRNCKYPEVTDDEYPENIYYSVKLKRYKTKDSYKFKNKLITSYSQMAKIKRAYKKTSGYNKNVYKRLSKYNKKYFTKGTVILSTETVFDGKNVKFSSAIGKRTEENNYTLTLTRKITGKKKSNKKENIHCFVEITKKNSEKYTKVKIK